VLDGEFISAHLLVGALFWIVNFTLLTPFSRELTHMG